jgi:hypothetical protein
VVKFVVAWCLAATAAAADTHVGLTLEGELSQGKFGQPISAAVDAEHDLTPRIAIAIAHSRYAMTGIRSSAGGSFCTGGPVGCEGGSRYDAVGADFLYRISPEVRLVSGIYALDLDDMKLGLKLAAQVRHPIGRFTFHTTPTVIVPDRWYATGGIDARLVSRLHADVSGGITAPLDQPSAWELPVAGELRWQGQIFNAGISFSWPRLTGGQDQPMGRAPLYGMDYRVVQIFFGITW